MADSTFCCTLLKTIYVLLSESTMGLFPQPKGKSGNICISYGEDRGENVGRNKWMEVFPLFLKTIVRPVRVIFYTSEEKEYIIPSLF